MVAGWRCNCPLCRLLVHPVLRRLGAGGQGGPAVPRREAGAAPPGEEATVVTPLGPGEGAGTVAGGEPLPPVSPKAAPVVDEELLEGFASKISASLREVVEGSNKVLLERLDRIEENVGKLRKEVKELVAGMENVIVEFREALGELSNPLFAQPLPAGGHQPPGGRAVGAAYAARLEALVGSLGELVEKAGLDTVLELLDEYVKAGLLSEEEARRLKALAKTIARLGSKKVDPRTVVAILAGGLGGEA